MFAWTEGLMCPKEGEDSQEEALQLSENPMSRRSRRWCLAAALAALGGLGATYHKTRPLLLPGLPDHAYVHGTISTQDRARSTTGILIEQRQPFSPGTPAVGGRAPAPGEVVRERIKVFQLDRERLQVDHCSVSGLAVILHESGYWTMSLRADQNAWMTDHQRDVSTDLHLRGPATGLRPPIPDLSLETNGLKRNQFFLKVRCCGAFPMTEPVGTTAPGKPVLFALPTAMFWVQRGYPVDLWDRKPLRDVRQYFDLVDRVEVDFSYR